MTNHRFLRPSHERHRHGLPANRYTDLSLAALLAWLIGFLMAGLGGSSLLQSLRCSAGPVSITCAELGFKGPPGSHYVTVSGFNPKLDGCVYWADERDGHWISVDVPLLAGNSPQPPVVATVYQMKNDQEVRQALSHPTLTGMLTQRGLRGDAAAAIAAYNPGMDTSSPWVLEVGSKPQSRSLMAGIFLGGIVLHTLGVFLFARPRPKDFQPGVVSVAAMSPLLVLVDGLHALAHKLPVSRRVWGFFMFPPAMALAVYGGQKFWTLANAADTAMMEADLIAVGGLIFGITFSLLAISFLICESKPDNDASAAV